MRQNPHDETMRTPSIPPHSLDRACCRKWWTIHCEVQVCLWVLYDLGMVTPQQIAMYYRKSQNKQWLALGLLPQCPCRDPAIDQAPHPEAIREAMALLATTKVPEGTDPWDVIEQVAQQVLDKQQPTPFQEEQHDLV